MTRYALLALVALYAGCATTPPPAEATRQETRWLLHGRLAAHAGEESWHGSLTWQQRDDGYRIEMVGPLGQGAVRLSRDEGGVTLRLADDAVYHDSDTEGLLRRHLGWVFPVAGLTSWIVGEPAPGTAESIGRDAEGRVTGIDQDGWRIGLDRYRDVDGRALPHRITLERPELRLRLVVDSWQLGAGDKG